MSDSEKSENSFNSDIESGQESNSIVSDGELIEDQDIPNDPQSPINQPQSGLEREDIDSEEDDNEIEEGEEAEEGEEIEENENENKVQETDLRRKLEEKYMKLNKQAESAKAKKKVEDNFEFRDELDFEEEEGEEGEEPEEQLENLKNVTISSNEDFIIKVSKKTSEDFIIKASKKTSEEGEEDDDDEEGECKEEGEISEEDEDAAAIRQEPKTVCRFFNKGQCTWGTNCRFLHPGVSDKGNYNMFAAPPRAPREGPEDETSKEKGSGGTDEVKRFVSEPGVESAWERGLRHAKEMLKRANKRKETDADFEEKRLNLSLGQSELERENFVYARPASPLTQKYGFHEDFPDDAFERHAIRSYRGGQYENLRYKVGNANVVNYPLPAKGADPPLGEEETRSRRAQGTAPTKEKRRAPQQKEKRYPRQWKEETGEDTQRPRDKGETWADPWARGKGAKGTRGSRNRSYSSGSSSRSSSRSSRSSHSSSSSYSRSSRSSYSSSPHSDNPAQGGRKNPPKHNFPPPQNFPQVHNYGGNFQGGHFPGGPPQPPFYNEFQNRNFRGGYRGRGDHHMHRGGPPRFSGPPPMAGGPLRPPNPPPNHPMAPDVHRGPKRVGPGPPVRIKQEPQTREQPGNDGDRVDMFGRTIRKEVPRSPPRKKSPSVSPTPFKAKAAARSRKFRRSPSRSISSRSSYSSYSTGSSRSPSPPNMTKKTHVKKTRPPVKAVTKVETVIKSLPPDDSGESDVEAAVVKPTTATAKLKKRKAETTITQEKTKKARVVAPPPSRVAPPPVRVAPPPKHVAPPPITPAVPLGGGSVSAARREELLKQLRAVEDAIARKRSKN